MSLSGLLVMEFITYTSYVHVFIIKKKIVLGVSSLQFSYNIYTCFRKQPKTFAFDHCFNSREATLPNFASQRTVFQSLGSDILDNAFDGYNACIFAYGQTGQLDILKLYTHKYLLGGNSGGK